MKICSKCKERKGLDQFTKSSRNKDGKQTWCKICNSTASTAWKTEKYSSDPLFRKYCKTTATNSARNRRKSDSTFRNYEHRISRQRWLKRQYKEQYAQMLKDQNGVCKICGKSDKTGRNLAVDHDHTSGKLRGLLCTECNRFLGVYENYKERFEKYLGEYRN